MDTKGYSVYKQKMLCNMRFHVWWLRVSMRFFFVIEVWNKRG